MQVPIKGARFALFRPKYTLYYVHTPKTGGSYVQAQFGRYAKRCPTLRLRAARGHKTWAEYRDIFSNAGIDFAGSYTFTTVRNPWDWHVGLFHYLRQNRDQIPYLHELFNTFSFEDYVRWNSEQPRRQIADWVVDPSTGEIAVHRVLRQENLRTDLQTMVNDLNLNIVVKEQRVNTSDRERDYRVYYNDRTAQLIADRHPDDIRLFGYSF